MKKAADDNCKACGACSHLERCSHCGNCKNCGKAMNCNHYYTYPSVPYPVNPRPYPIWYGDTPERTKTTRIFNMSGL